MRKNIIYASSLIVLIISVVSCRDENYPEFNKAIVKTADIVSIAGSVAVGGGMILDNGGDKISTQGICWDTIPDPEIGLNSVVDTLELDEFSCLISGLSGGTTYYVRAYATNNAGISYGENINFTTNPVPVLTTSDASNITGTTAVAGGEITKTFEIPILEVGICCGVNANPDIDDNKFIAESVSNTFTVEISGMEPSTVYHIRSYAINENGEIGYGNNKTFSTAILDYDGNVYSSVLIGNNQWMTENYKCTHFNDGTEVSYSYHSGDVNKEYGASYSWNDIVNPNFTPKGWHVATDAEWRALYEFVESKGIMLKEQGADHWNTDNGTNETGFTAFGSAHIYGAPLKAEGTWWTADENTAVDGLRWAIFDSGDIGRFANDKNMQFPVRLVKD